MFRSTMTRRSALRLASGTGIGGLVAAESGVGAAFWADHPVEDRAVEIEWLRYTDAAGAELGQIRPTWMLDITDHDGVETPVGERDLALHLRVRNTGIADLVVAPGAFALWATTGFLYRPHDVYATASGGDLEDSAVQHANDWHIIGAEHRLTADPIAPRSEQDGNITFRVPAAAWFAGLLFTPEPERALLLADFRRTTFVIAG